ncbi:hypothetical protein LCGC14_2471660 [marine sediment metagenome]|uniref:Uncharacterized protein n=1 Tax=marine sediment metagenome TaxID=412755 RepID=A0A0F9BAY7_9ZZZZ
MGLRIKRDREHHSYVKPQAGDQALWLAVLCRAIRDLFSMVAVNKRNARAFLFTDYGYSDIDGHYHNFKWERQRLCDLANIEWSCWSDQIKGFTQGMKHCDYVLVDGYKMNGRECAKYISKMLARAAND